LEEHNFIPEAIDLPTQTDQKNIEVGKK